MSITGDGSSGTPLKLVNDNASPGANKYYGTDNGGTKGWQAVGANINIGNSDLIATADRHFSGSATHSFYLDSFVNFTVNLDGQGGETTIIGPGQSARFEVANNDIWLNNAGAITGNFHNYGDSITSDVSDFTGSIESTVKLTADSILFKQTAGRYFFFNIPAANDTSLNKPIAYNLATKTLTASWTDGREAGEGEVWHWNQMKHILPDQHSRKAAARIIQYSTHLLFSLL